MKMSIPATVFNHDGTEYAVVTVVTPHPLGNLEGSLLYAIDTATRIWAHEHQKTWFPDKEEAFDENR